MSRTALDATAVPRNRPTAPGRPHRRRPVASVPVAEFLSDAWLDELEQAAALAGAAPAELRLVIQQVVLDGPRGDEVAAYAIGLRDGAISLRRGHVDDADVTFTQHRATAAAIARGDMSAQAAFLAGDLRVGGDLRTALEQGKAITAIEDVFAEVRATTTW